MSQSPTDFEIIRDQVESWWKWFHKYRQKDEHPPLHVIRWLGYIEGRYDMHFNYDTGEWGHAPTD